MSVHEQDDLRGIRPQLQGELVRLRAIEEDDLPRLSEMFNDPEVLRFLESVTFPQSLAGTREWWEHSRGDETTQNFAIETLAGELVGGCGLMGISARSRVGTLGIWIGQPFWNKGYGTDAVRTLCRFAFSEMNLHRVELQVHDTNPRGRRAYEKVGFKEEGRLRRSHFSGGRYTDTIVMGLLEEELIEP
jgi:RimJ/RimL family protein N-acetyltransferase